MAIADGPGGRALSLRLLSDERLAPLPPSASRAIVRHDADAADVLQTAMMKALTALRHGRRTGPLRPWLFRIAHNEAVSLLRARGRHAMPVDTPPEVAAADTYREVEAREGLTEILDDLARLTAHQRSALVMRALAGMSYDEIAHALDTTPLAARQAVFVARRHLRERGDARLRRRLRLLLPPVGFASSVSFAPKAAVTAAVCAATLGTTAGVSPEPPREPTTRRVTASVAPPAPTPRTILAAATPTATPESLASGSSHSGPGARATPTPTPRPDLVDHSPSNSGPGERPRRREHSERLAQHDNGSTEEWSPRHRGGTSPIPTGPDPAGTLDDDGHHHSPDGDGSRQHGQRHHEPTDGHQPGEPSAPDTLTSP